MNVSEAGSNGSVNDLLRRLPGLHELLSIGSVAELSRQYSQAMTTHAARKVLETLRVELRRHKVTETELTFKLEALPKAIQVELERRTRPRLRRVINATGVILQTNLGRAPLSEAALQRVVEIARGYCNLEYDVEEAHRTYRDVNADELVLNVLRARAVPPTSTLRTTDVPLGVAVVNNCAAATFLALNTLAEGGEVLVSRGELVEIGGGFRIPDILAKSGAVLREVGTTNKTRLVDYAAAISPATKLILRVHRSNFRIEGFTEQPSLDSLVALAKERGLPLFDDQGTGCIVNLDEVALPGQASWLASVASGAALVASSGDKLLGGPQCGLLVGEAALIERLRSNPLYRALRVDKLTYAALEATLLAYLTHSEEQLPVIGMIRLDAEEVRVRCERLARALATSTTRAEVVSANTAVGGGTTPGAVLPSFAVALQVAGKSAHSLATSLRACEPAIVARIQNDLVLLDLRTVAPWEEAELQHLIQGALRDGLHA